MLICLEATSTAPLGGVPRISQSIPAKIFRPKNVTRDHNLASQTVAPRGRIRTGRKSSDRMVVAIRNHARNSAERSQVIIWTAAWSPGWRDISHTRDAAVAWYA